MELGVGRLGESGSEPQGTGTALVAAQCVGNEINAHLYSTGTDASSVRGYLEHSPDQGAT